MTKSSKTRFTLRPGEWYAVEFIGDEFGIDGELRSRSAIRVEEITLSHTGQRQFELSFYHANYPAGVQGKIYTLQTLERGEHYILARSADHTPARVMLIYDITWEWLRTHFGVPQPSDSEDMRRWLNLNF